MVIPGYRVITRVGTAVISSKIYSDCVINGAVGAFVLVALLAGAEFLRVGVVLGGCVRLLTLSFAARLLFAVILDAGTVEARCVSTFGYGVQRTLGFVSRTSRSLN